MKAQSFVLIPQLMQKLCSPGLPGTITPCAPLGFVNVAFELLLKGHTTNIIVFRLKLSKSNFLFRYVLQVKLLAQLKFECNNFRETYTNLTLNFVCRSTQTWKPVYTKGDDIKAFGVSPSPTLMLIGSCSFQYHLQGERGQGTNLHSEINSTDHSSATSLSQPLPTLLAW